MNQGVFHVSFDPRSPEDRTAVKQLIAVYERGLAEGEEDQEAEEWTGPINPKTYQDEIRQILDLSCGKLLAAAVQHYGPGEQFDMKQLADRSEVDLDTILSWNRTLGNSCRAREIRKRHILQDHGGNPKKFSIPRPFYDSIVRMVNS